MLQTAGEAWHRCRMCSTAHLGKGKQHHSTSSGLFGAGEGRAGQKSLSEEGWMWGKFRQCNSEPKEETPETCTPKWARYTRKCGANSYVQTRINYLA